MHCVFISSTSSSAGDWRPRLERLSEARGLAHFERQVLLLLVGYHVSPSVQRTFSTTRSGFDDMGSAPVTVSDCPCTLGL